MYVSVKLLSVETYCRDASNIFGLKKYHVEIIDDVE